MINLRWQKIFLLTLGFLVIASAILIVRPAQTLKAKSHRQLDSSRSKIAALTFDDGPYGAATLKILEILKEKNVRATFFVIGKNAQQYPEILKREIQDGHVVGNHSFDHSKFLALETTAVFSRNLRAADSAIFKVTGLRPRFFRPPYGLRSPMMEKALKSLGYTMVLWNDATDDYNTIDSAAAIKKNILKNLKPMAIIDLHDGRDTHINYSRENLIEALPDVIDAIAKRGYTFVTIDQILNQEPYFKNYGR